MLRVVIAAAAAFFLAGCVTPMTVEQQSPVLQYQPQGTTLVAVVDSRARVHEGGKTPRFLGFGRVYGAPMDWNVNTIAMGESRDQTMSGLLSSRIITGMNANGGTALAVSLASPLDDGAAEALLRENAAENLVTINVREWHFDVNTSWVGAFRFDSDFDVTVQRANGGTVMQETFTENQAIDARAEESWGNMILLAYRDKLAQALNDPDVRAALTAPPAPAAVETADAAASGS